MESNIEQFTMKMLKILANKNGIFVFLSFGILCLLFITSFKNMFIHKSEEYLKVKKRDPTPMMIGITTRANTKDAYKNSTLKNNQSQMLLKKICSNRGFWRRGTYINQPPSDDCRRFVKQFLAGYQSNTWLFLGDSTMRMLSLQRVKTCKIAHRCHGRCTFMEYLRPELQQNTSSKCIPHLSAGCLSVKYSCAHSKTVEYLAIYWANGNWNIAKPYEHISTHSAIESYLKSESMRDVCVVNVGLHPMAEMRSDYKYVSDVRTYLTYLLKYCRKLIWISITSVQERPKYNQTNEVALRWNAKILTMLEVEFPTIAYIDMYPMSLQKGMHLDNVHLNNKFYATAATMFMI